MFLIMYDIESNKLRTKFSKFLEGYGIRMQYSVFKITNSPRILNNLKIDIETKFEKRFGQGDSVLIYQVPDDACIAKYGYPVNDDSDLIIC